MNEIERARVLKTARRTHKEKEADLFLEAATMFGHRLGDAVRAGIPREQAIVFVQEHLRILGKVLIEFADMAPVILDKNPKGNT